MEESNKNQSLGRLQKIILSLVALLLFITLLFFRLVINSSAPLEQLAKNSIDLNLALTNGKPTVLEFYADWCESCKSMAPNMLLAESKYPEMINIVMLNVDNSLNQELIDKYKVNGIPQLNFLDKFGNSKVKEIGFRSFEQIDALFEAFLSGRELDEVSRSLGVTNLEAQSSIFSYPKENTYEVNPRSHG